MQTKVKSEVSKKSKWWIPKERYLELQHFCKQYPYWQMMRDKYDGLAKPGSLIVPRGSAKTDPTLLAAVARSIYQNKMNMVERAAKEADNDICDYIVLGVTKGIPYKTLKLAYDIPCGESMYYDRYRKFFYMLNQIRD